ncbi:RNAse R [Panacagrimonas perspica]|uniref:Ribonuclease R n=2 Tax=Panacagrimonas perspica TaxID=381431 RepID=A0A4S3K0J0_9GAMM|nr:RNAse R [Panacagrimonas perspica]THD01419.1 ribonuclease R [Panacagrimonas perspica]
MSMKRKNKQENNDWRGQDPAYKAESERYADPIPSRQLILDRLEKHAGPLTLDDLIGSFALTKLDQQSALEKRLAAMVRQGELVQNRIGAFGPLGKMNAVAGTVQAHRDGFGFLVPDTGPPDIFLPPRQMRELMNGDRALVRITGTDFKGRPEGSVVEVLTRTSRQVVGRLHIEQGASYVIPDNQRVQQDLLIPPDMRSGAKHGQMVVAEITAPPGHRTLPVGKVIEILGEHLAPGMEIEAAIRAHNLPHVFGDDVLREAEAIPNTVQPQQLEGRVDLRKLGLVTIDGADSRDFDDAVHARKVRFTGGWLLTVAIADVAAYVRPGTALDREATERGNSVYFPDRAIPMLPEKLSNGLCSLNPNVDRLCMVCELRVNSSGEVTKSRFFEGVMNSDARLVYDDVAAALGGEAGRVPDKVLPALKVLDDCFAALLAARERRGAIDFESSETKIVFGADRKIERIVAVQRNRAHRLIEECMIAANVEAAKFVAKHKLPAPYRIHEKPDAMKVQALREFLQAQGLKLGGSERPEAMDYAKLMARCKDKPNRSLIQTVMLRSLMQARYSADNNGHFGLALEHYAHFTSPIRRYPDLVLHRGLKHLIRRAKVSDFLYSAADIERQGAHCSMTERRADDATRDAVVWLKCEYMSDRVGEEFDGVVSGVAPFGLFVELGGLHVDGLIHVSSLSNDYYKFEQRHHRLIGERTGRVFNLGDTVRVKVVRVNLDERKIDLEIAGSPKSSSTIKGAPTESRQNQRGGPQRSGQQQGKKRR